MAPLATRDDLEVYLGYALPAERADFLLDGATGAVRTHCGWHIAESVTETVTLDGSGATILTLPSLHVTAVNSVTEDGDAVTVADIEWSAAGFLKRSTAWTSKLRGVVVNLTHGYATTPPEVRDIVLAAAARTSAMPVPVEREQVGDYSVSYAKVSLLSHELNVLDRYTIARNA